MKASFFSRTDHSERGVNFRRPNRSFGGFGHIRRDFTSKRSICQIKFLRKKIGLCLQLDLNQACEEQDEPCAAWLRCFPRTQLGKFALSGIEDSAKSAKTKVQGKRSHWSTLSTFSLCVFTLSPAAQDFLTFPAKMEERAPIFCLFSCCLIWKVTQTAEFPLVS